MYYRKKSQNIIIKINQQLNVGKISIAQLFKYLNFFYFINKKRYLFFIFVINCLLLIFNIYHNLIFNCHTDKKIRTHPLYK